MAKKSSIVGVIVVTLIVVAVIALIYYGMGQYSIIAPTCQTELVMNNGVQLISFNEVRQVSGIQYTDAQLSQNGFYIQDGKVFVKYCEVLK